MKRNDTPSDKPLLTNRKHRRRIQGDQGLEAPPVNQMQSSPSKAPANAAGNSVRLPPIRHTLTIMLMTVNKSSVPGLGTFVSSTMISVV